MFKKKTKIIENPQSIGMSSQLLYELVGYSKTKNTYYEITAALLLYKKLFE